MEMALVRGGTVAFTLTAQSIAQAARADMERKIRNGGGSGSREHYAFHRKHVKKAKTAAEIVAAALKNPEDGLGSDKPATVLLYKDTALLRAALTLLS